MKSLKPLCMAVSLRTIAALAFLPVCGAQSNVPSLAGTKWRLAQIQSMDDAIGTKRPTDRLAYTMTLNADGTVVLRLNCNSANGKWSAKPSSDPASGQFTFVGPIAMTRAMCPPPSFDEQIARQAPYVRSYLLKDGKLNLSLMADGGIYVWEPLPAAPERDLDIEAAILEAFPDYTRTAAGQDSGLGKARYVYERIDLNGDRRQEVFVYLLGPFFCGTGGCNLLLLTPRGTGYSTVGNFPITRTPILVSSSRTLGWNTFWRLESGGGARASYVQQVFNGKRFAPKARVPAAKAPVGNKVLAGEIQFENAIPLEPKN